jgi:hypothetical protein
MGNLNFFLFQTCLNSLSRGVELRPAGCYPGALTIRLETLRHLGRALRFGLIWDNGFSFGEKILGSHSNPPPVTVLSPLVF